MVFSCSFPSAIARSRRAVVLAFCLMSAGAGAAEWGEEARDWGVPAVSQLRQAPYSAPTPLEIPGAQRVLTDELRQMLAGATPPILVDVAGGAGHLSLKGAVWLSGAGRGAHFLDPVQAVLSGLLVQLTGGDKTRPMAFFCVDVRCWLSYNAALRAVALGYTRVLWYRGGVLAWRDAGLPLEAVTVPAEK